ncbi:NUDIX domain-containing protein [Candidatus Woesearchaeota archaeon]|nr:NUDIX domain-containing protein [Candidatus Woesearchaeota archaeon]
MKSEYKSLPFRNNVALIVFKDTKFLLVNLVDWDEEWWKFPQGGIDDGEDVVAAGKREFREEIGTNKIKILGQSQYTNKYDWPDEVIERKGRQFRGQWQRFLVVEFLGTDADIKIDTAEVRKYKWVARKEIVQFSKDSQHMLFQNYNGSIPKILQEFSL